MRLRSFFMTAMCAAGLFVSSAFATPIDYFTGTVTTGSTTQLGRPSRSGIAQTWTGAETYTGVLATSTATTYYYNTYTYSASLFTGAPYVDISFFDETNSGLLFITAYAGSYDPTSRGTNWLGDVGSSGNISFFAGDLGDARYFDVLLPVGKDLVLVVNTTGGGTSGTGKAFDVDINAFSDTMYTDAVPPAVTPEPSTLIELGTGMLAMVGVVRRRLRAAA